MTGSIQIKGQTIYVVVAYKDRYGKKKHKWISTGLKEGAGKRRIEEKRKEIIRDFEKEYSKMKYTEWGGVLLNTRVKFLKFLDVWLETIKPPLSVTTYTAYCKNIRKVKRYFEQYDLYLDQLKPAHIQAFYNTLSAEGLSANTVIHVHANVHKALSFAVKQELIATNPSEKTERPKYVKYVASFYNKEELTKLFECFKGDRMELCVHIAAYYGLRRSEVIGLKWDAIDFKNKTISIKHKVINAYNGNEEELIAEDKLKNASSTRVLPLIPHIEELLLEEQRKQEYYRSLIPKGYNRDYLDYICLDNMGNLISPNYVSDHFRHMIKKHNLKKIRFHDLRHSCASLLLASGISMKQIQEWLGHSTYNVTANFYSHLDYNSKIASAEAINKALG